MIIETRWWVEHVYLGCVENVFRRSCTMVNHHETTICEIVCGLFPGIEHDKQIKGFRDFLPSV